jgi:hypothetical protein
MPTERTTIQQRWLYCRRCDRTWQATYQVRTFHDDAGDHQLFYRNGAPAAAPWTAPCPFCGGLRVTIVPGPPPAEGIGR